MYDQLAFESITVGSRNAIKAFCFFGFNASPIEFKKSKSVFIFINTI